MRKYNMDLPTADHARLMQYLFPNVADVLRQYSRKIQQPSFSKTLRDHFVKCHIRNYYY